MHLEVIFNPNALLDSEVRDRTVVVLEVLRTSSTIVTALHNGAKSIVPAATLGDAARMAANLDAKVFLLGGEKGGIKIDGYHLGNSPSEYSQEVVQNRTLIMHTSNATPAIVNAKSAKSLAIGCFLNLTRVANFLIQENNDTLIICGGQRNHISLADVLCVGQLVDLLVNAYRANVTVGDAAYVAHNVYQKDRDQIAERIGASTLGQFLKQTESEGDVAFCTQTDMSSILPIFDPSKLAILAA